jgi:hypothetical protein
MPRSTKVQMIAVLAIGSLLGYVAASGNLRLNGAAALAEGQTAAAQPADTKPAPGDGAGCCADGADKARLLAMADPKVKQAVARAEEKNGKRPRNIIFVICDQETYQLAAKDDYKLPARQTLMRHGVTFRNHYIASAMCTASRAAFLSGQPPQVTGVFDQMQYGYVPSLNPDRVNLGSMMKGLGYKTAYFGKFEMDKKLLVVSYEACRPTPRFLR